MKIAKTIVVGLFLSLFYISGIKGDYFSNNEELQYGNTNGNIVNGGYALKIDDVIYISSETMPSEFVMYRYNLNTKTVEHLANDCIGSLNFYNDLLYYSSSTGIVSTDKDGIIVDKYYDNFCRFIIHDNKIILVDGTIFMIDIKNKEMNKLNNVASIDVNVIDDNIYYIAKSSSNIEDDGVDIYQYYGAGQIHAMDIRGGNNRIISNEIVFNLIYNDNFLYFISIDNFKIGRIDLLTNQLEYITNDKYSNFNIDKNQIIACNFKSTIDCLSTSGEILKSYQLDPFPRDPYININDGLAFYHNFGYEQVNMLDLNSGNTQVIIEMQ